ncbi:MAG: DUF503 domain-containing protein [Thermoanaerobaculia bacterium]
MFVGIGVLELELSEVHDLKSKRRVVHGLVDRLHARHRISAAEVGSLELWQRAEIGIAIVAAHEADVRRMLDHVLAIADDQSEATVTRWDPQILEESE